MGFAENLKALRKEKHISQEELAELMNVSRQAVSKWEQGSGYPEVEKMMVLSKALNVSLDYLMCAEGEAAAPRHSGQPVTGKILIKAHDGKAIVNCYKVLSSNMFKTRKDEPKYALFGVEGASFWGDSSTLLGWYADEESLTKEVDAIMEALQNGVPSYELKYAAKVRQSLLTVKLER